jgi:hypothetical protein
MNCEIFLEAFEKNFDIILTEEDKEQFCEWAKGQARAGKLNVQSLLASSPEGLSSKLSDINKLKEQERLAIQDALEILIDVYLGSNLIE